MLYRQFIAFWQPWLSPKIGLILLLCCSYTIHAKTWYVGVLSPRGAQIAQKKWSPWFQTMQNRWPNEQFILVPLNIDKITNTVETERLDFILAPQTTFITLHNNQQLRWLVSLEKENASPIYASEEVGTAIWVRHDSPIQSLSDLKKQQLAAVSPHAFGGYLMGLKLLNDEGLRENLDYQIQFTGYPIDNILNQLQNKKVDAAITPVCLLEEMHNNHLLNQQDFRLLHPIENSSACQSSSPLLPSWMLAAMPSVPNAFAKEITHFLLEPQAAPLPQWTSPMNSKAAEAVLRSVYRHPDQPAFWPLIQHWLRENRWWVLAALFTLVLLLINTAWMNIIAHKRRQKLKNAYQQMREYEALMVQNDRVNLLGEMASGIAHEMNQPLSVIQSYAEGSLIRLQSIDHTQSVQKAQEKIMEQVQRSVDIISNLRSFAKPDMAFTPSYCQLHHVVSQCCTFFQIQYSKSTLVIHNQIPLDMALTTVASVIEQVLINCILNSHQQGANHLAITAHIDQGNVHLQAIDDGGGFLAERLDFPFTPFKSTKKTGLGLGLVICERLSHSVKGQLILKNRDDGIAGAIVELVLPQTLHESNHKPAIEER